MAAHFQPSGNEYGWRQGAYRHGASAQAVGERIEWLRWRLKSDPDINELVGDARNPVSPLHQLFNWDDADAAERWRVQEARNLLRDLQVVKVRILNHEPRRPIRAIVTVASDKSKDGRDASERGAARPLRPIETVLEDPAMRKQLVRRAFLEALAFKRRYEHIAELCEVIKAIEKAANEFDPSLNVPLMKPAEVAAS